MSLSVLVIGESGTGKSSSLRNLAPEETFIINVLDKPLPFRGFRGKYIAISEGATKGNYFSSDNAVHILQVISVINNKRPDIKNLIIDDFQYVMSNEFMKRAQERGFDKFTEIGKNAHAIMKSLTACRIDLNCVVLGHSDVGSDGKSRCKTIGKMIDEKICLEGMFTIVLQTSISDGKYRFLTQNNGSSIAKSPEGMFEQEYIDNDLHFVINQAKEYFNADIPQ